MSNCGTAANPDPNREFLLGGTFLFGHHNNFVLRHGVERSFINAQMGYHEFRWCVGEPLRKRQVLIEAALEHLQKFQVVVAGILNVVGQRLEDISNVPGLKVHGAGTASGSEHSHSSSTADVVLPFVGIGMPM